MSYFCFDQTMLIGDIRTTRFTRESAMQIWTAILNSKVIYSDGMHPDDAVERAVCYAYAYVNAMFFLNMCITKSHAYAYAYVVLGVCHKMAVIYAELYNRMVYKEIARRYNACLHKLDEKLLEVSDDLSCDEMDDLLDARDGYIFEKQKEIDEEVKENTLYEAIAFANAWLVHANRVHVSDEKRIGMFSKKYAKKHHDKFYASWTCANSMGKIYDSIHTEWFLFRRWEISQLP